MKLNYFIILLLTLLISENCLSQKSFKKKFDFYEFIATVDGQEVERKIIGAKCKLRFNKKKGIYNLTFNRVAKYKGIATSYVKKGFLNFKIVKNDADGIIVKKIEDTLSLNPFCAIKDSTKTKQKFEFITTIDKREIKDSPKSKRKFKFLTTIEKDKMVIIQRLFNEND